MKRSPTHNSRLCSFQVSTRCTTEFLDGTEKQKHIICLTIPSDVFRLTAITALVKHHKHICPFTFKLIEGQSDKEQDDPGFECKLSQCQRDITPMEESVPK